MSDRRVMRCPSPVPCPNFDGTWSGEPLGLPVEPDPKWDRVNLDWIQRVTEQWKKHPFLRGAQDALSRLHDQAAHRAENVGNLDDAFRFGKMAGYEWALEAAQFLIDEYKEEG